MLIRTLLLPLIIFVSLSCQNLKVGDSELESKVVYVTSESGDKMEAKPNVKFTKGKAELGVVIKSDPSVKKQKIDGIGTSFTEASAFVLAHLDEALRKEIMQNIYSENGANFSLARTHIGACDFSVEGKYSYVDKETAEYVYGAAVNWYESTYKVYEDVFDRVHKKFPDFAIMHTEGCIDDLGKEPPEGVTDPERRKEKNWFDNDSFWWNDNATDWAYAVNWAGVKTEDHPLYTPVQRYARNIIVSIDHWVAGWIDWNIVLDRMGGPNHVGNYCGAPIMIDTKTQKVYYTPIYYVLKQFSRTIRPGDQAVKTQRVLNGLDSDALHACATINDANLLTIQLLNTTRKPLEFSLRIEDNTAVVKNGSEFGADNKNSFVIGGSSQ